jgi:hypothetical protein
LILIFKIKEYEGANIDVVVGGGTAMMYQVK